MTEQSSDRSWLVPGAKVVGLSTGGWNDRIDFESTVERVGKRDIVLANGRRFRLSDLGEQGRSYGSRLARPNSPEVAEFRRKEQQTDLTRVVWDAYDAWNRGVGSRDSVEKATAVIDAMNALRSHLAQGGGQ